MCRRDIYDEKKGGRRRRLEIREGENSEEEAL